MHGHDLLTYAHRLRRLLLTAVMCLVVSVCLAGGAQDNPYKILDLLYREYLSAYDYRTKPEGIDRARLLYRHAEQLGDRKAQCMALTIPVIYYAMAHNDEAAFNRAVKELQDAATKYGYEQYYYYGVTNRVNFLINRKRIADAFQYVSQVEQEARRQKSPYGSFTALNSLGQLHVMRNECGQAIDCYRKALDYGVNYLRDQDMAPQYRKIAESYESLDRYDEALRYAEKGYAVSRTSISRLRSIRGICYAAFMLGDYDRFHRYYDVYTKMARRPDPESYSLHEREIAILKLMCDGSYDEAWRYIDKLPAGYVAHKYAMKVELLRLRRDYRYMANCIDTLYISRIRGIDVVNDKEYDRLNSIIFNQLLSFENQRLALDRQRMLNERQRAEISISNLELANTQLSLRNSSLELHRTRSAADIMRLSYNRKRLEAERLRGQVEAQRTQTELHRTLLATLGIVAIVIAVAVIAYLANHRRMMRRLNRANSLLEERHRLLAEEKERAEAANRAKTAFIQSMGEEIRQPLYSAVSCAHAIANSTHLRAPQPELDSYNATLQKSTDDMLRLVATVLKKAQGGT